ncbi:E3 ubiquitin-protein ligase NEURL3-like [Pristis pectinata]|uniref:E3 ubiquitin-protein ligase NEURL3-like n=1 Tax=Pristis pectinata TaxID=685728 RepID=UPI00223DC428|nr:E3 ubiquitin-protein ligase NEURL3-like [Pristis pectinata]
MGNNNLKEDPRELERRNNQLSTCERKTECCQKPVTSHDPLFFHPYTKGSQIKLDSSNQCAWRKSGFCNGITFTNRPILIQEKVKVKITKMDVAWNGALRLGCTIFNPSLIDPNALPKFICPDLEDVHGFWAKALPEDFIQEGAIISFWVNKQGFFMYHVNGGRKYHLMEGLLVDHPLWLMVDVYGTTRGVQLLDPCMKFVSQNKLPEWPSVTVRSDEPQTLQTRAPVFSAIPNNGHSEPSPRISKPLTNNHPQSSKSLDEDCVVCFSHQVNSVIYKCGHMCMCYGCGQKLFSRKSTCPICRQPIKEIIKTFRS